MPSSPPKSGVVEFEVIAESWSVLQILDDENVMVEVKPVIFEVIRTGDVDAYGRPIYAVKASLATRVVQHGKG